MPSAAKSTLTMTPEHNPDLWPPARTNLRPLLSLAGCGVFSIAGALLLTLTSTMTSTLAQTPAPPAISTELATLGGGCFWCVEAVFERLPGIRSVVSGYAGGHTPNPTYQAVCDGSTGHAEVVQIEFEPARISYAEILDLFWRAHDPTTPNRQGADVGSQYRSIILYHDDAQRQTAERSKKEAASAFDQPIVTEILPLDVFFVAEDYHQDYFRKNPNAPYCVAVIKPKLKKLDRLKQK
jgi:peptide-methionine (S)-S-oxide reductase